MNLRRKLIETYWSMERRIVPGLEYSQHHYERCLLKWVPERASWLDVGCGRRLLPTWRAEGERALVSRASPLVGIDLDLDSLKDNSTADSLVYGPIGALPFEAESFDVVTANMVVEHLANPANDFVEVSRVLRKGGLFFVHTPNVKAFPTALMDKTPNFVKARLARLLDGRAAEDVFPTYYRCNSAEALAECARKAGLVPVEIGFVSTTAVFSILPPLAFLELLWLRAIQRESRKHLRSNLIAVMRKS